MGLFSCKTCEAKDQTIEALRQELAHAHARARKLDESIVALADPLAHARAYRPPKPEGETKPREQRGVSPFDAMAEAPVLIPGLPGGLPQTQRELEAMFAERARNQAGRAEPADPPKAS